MSLCTARVAPEEAVFRPALPLHLQPEFTGEPMATMTYRAQLLHPNWQRKRLEILQRDDFTCQGCYDKESTLHVHHKQYVKGRMAWEYPDGELVTLCEDCHEVMHEQNNRFRELLAQLDVQGPWSFNVALSIVAGWASHRLDGVELSSDAPWVDEPGGFIAGQLAAHFEQDVNLDAMCALLDAMGKTPRWVMSGVLSSAARQMLERRNEPRPPSPFDDMDL